MLRAPRPRAYFQALRTSCKGLDGLRGGSPWLGNSVLVHRSFSSETLRLNREKLNLVPVKPYIEAVMEATQVEPDNARFTEKIVRLGREGRWVEAQGLFGEVKVKNTVLYTAMIITASRCNKYDEGMQYFAEMQSVGVPRNAATYCCALTILGRQSKLAEALQLWAEMGQVGVGQDNEACLTAVLDAMALAGDVEAAQRFLDEAQSKGMVLNAAHYGCLLKACREAGDPHKAVNAMPLVLGRNIVHYTLVLGACTKAAAADKISQEQVEELVRWVAAAMSTDAVQPDRYFLEEQVRALLRVADLKLILEGQRPPSSLQASVALQSLKAARLSGTYPTGLLRAVEMKLQDILRAAGGSQQPSVQAQQPRTQAQQPQAQQPQAQQEQQPQQPAASAAKEAPQEEAAILPHGWAEAQDPASGSPYFWRISDPANSTTWDRPQAA